jgi:hypothetical protein
MGTGLSLTVLPAANVLNGVASVTVAARHGRRIFLSMIRSVDIIEHQAL